MMVGTLVDRQHHATAHQSSGCPPQLSAEHQNSDAPLHSLLTAVCGGCAALPGVAAGVLTEKPNVELLITQAMLRLFYYSRGPCGLMYDVELLLAHVYIRDSTSTWADNLRLILGTSVHMTIKSHMCGTGVPQDPVDFPCRSRSLIPSRAL